MQAIFKTRRLMGLLLVSLMACGGAGDGSSGDSGGTFSSADWRLVTGRKLQAGIDFNGATGTLTLVNNSGAAVEAPSLFIYDTTTGDEAAVTIAAATSIADGATFTASLTYPNGSEPAADAYFGISLGDIKAGKFASATAFDSLPLFVKEGASSDSSASSISSALTAASSLSVPTTGIWDFTMTGATTNLVGSNCPSGSAGFISVGNGTLTVDCDGLTADLDIDSSHIAFYLMNTATGQFESPEYPFPVRDDEDNIVYGTATYEMTAQTTTSLSGELHWDNSLGCTADYPFTMNLQTQTDLTVNDICDGPWTMSYDTPVTCNSITVPTINLPLAGTMTNYSGPGGTPVALGYNFSSTGTIFMTRHGCTNTYGNLTTPTVFTFATDSFGAPVNINISFQGIANSSTSITGVGFVNGSGPSTPICTGSFLYTLSAATSC